MKKRIISALSALICLTMLLSSCSVIQASFNALLSAFGYYQPELTAFWEMEYERPDVQGLLSDIDDLIEMLEAGKSKKNELYNALYDITDEYYNNYLTMESLAFIEYTHAINDDEALDEYYYLTDNDAVIMAKLEELYILCAKSKYVSSFERIFGAGFFDTYKESENRYSEEYLKLVSSENSLLRVYREDIADSYIVYDGVKYTRNDIDGITDEYLYNEVYFAYYKKYNSIIGRTYVQLVETRQKIADLFEYDSYAEYAYENIYNRDYSPEQTADYIADVKKYIVPVFKKFDKTKLTESYYSLPEISPEGLLSAFEKITAKMSPKLSDTLGLMKEKGLYSINNSYDMYAGSYELYLNKYASPYLFVNGLGNQADIFTLAHEFGHFTSSYVNYGYTGSIDESEVASQGLELLVSRYLTEAFDDDSAKRLKNIEIFNTVSTFVTETAYTEFENRVYADKNITIDKCNQIFAECCENYGIISTAAEREGAGLSWVFVNHFIEYPYYVIGYAVSVDAAVQVYRLDEDNDGAGVKKYLDFIDRDYDMDFFENLKRAGLDNPFEVDHLEKVADYFLSNID